MVGNKSKLEITRSPNQKWEHYAGIMWSKPRRVKENVGGMQGLRRVACLDALCDGLDYGYGGLEGHRALISAQVECVGADRMFSDIPSVALPGGKRLKSEAAT